MTCRSILIRSCERPAFVILRSSELSGHSSSKSLSARSWSDSMGAISIRISLGCVYFMSKACLSYFFEQGDSAVSNNAHHLEFVG